MKIGCFLICSTSLEEADDDPKRGGAVVHSKRKYNNSIIRTHTPSSHSYGVSRCCCSRCYTHHILRWIWETSRIMNNQVLMVVERQRGSLHCSYILHKWYNITERTARHRLTLRFKHSSQMMTREARLCDENTAVMIGYAKLWLTLWTRVRRTG